MKIAVLGTVDGLGQSAFVNQEQLRIEYNAAAGCIELYALIPAPSEKDSKAELRVAITSFKGFAMVQLPALVSPTSETLSGAELELVPTTPPVVSTPRKRRSKAAIAVANGPTGPTA